MKHTQIRLQLLLALAATVGLVGACRKRAPDTKSTPSKNVSDTTNKTHTTRSSGPAKRRAPAPALNRNKVPRTQVDYKPGHTLTPRAALLTWLKKNAKRNGRRVLFRLPVVVVVKDKHRLGVGRAFVGTSPKDSGQDKLHLNLEDTRLGISLMSRLRHKCDKKALACAVWIEGTWGRLLRGPRLPPTTSTGPKAHPFAITFVGKLLKDSDAKAQAMIAK